jgi:hypothetical protein
MVPAVAVENIFPVGVDHHQLDGGGADVDSHFICMQSRIPPDVIIIYCKSDTLLYRVHHIRQAGS